VAVEYVLSPKSQELVYVPELIEELFEKTKLLPLIQSEVSDGVKIVTGCGLTYKLISKLSLHPYPEVVMSFAIKVPGERYVCVGDDDDEVELSPKFHKLLKVPRLMAELLVKTKLLPFKHREVSLTEKVVTG